MNENYSPEYTTPNDATTVVSKRPLMTPETWYSFSPLTRAMSNLKTWTPLNEEERSALQMYHNRNSTSEIRPQLDGSIEVGMNGNMLEGETPERLWMEYAVGKPAFEAMDWVINPALKAVSNGIRNTTYRTARHIPGLVGNTIRHGLASRALSNTLNRPLTRDVVNASVKAALDSKTMSGPLGNGLEIVNGKIVDSSGLELADITTSPFTINGETYNFSNFALNPKGIFATVRGKILSKRAARNARKFLESVIPKRVDPAVKIITERTDPDFIKEFLRPDGEFMRKTKLFGKDPNDPRWILAYLRYSDAETLSKFGITDRTLLDGNANNLFYELNKDLPGYRGALSAEDILSEIRYAFEPSELVTESLDDVTEFYRRDVLPRLIENLEKHGVDYYSPANASLRREIEDLYNNPTKHFPIIKQYMEPSWAAYYSGRDKMVHIPNNGVTEFDTYIHEYHHALRDRLNEILDSYGINLKAPTPLITDSSGNIVENHLISANWDRFTRQMNWPEYTSNEIDLMQQVRGFDDVDRLGITPTSEIGASAIEARGDRYFMELKNRLGRYPTREEVDELMLKDLNRGNGEFLKGVGDVSYFPDFSNHSTLMSEPTPRQVYETVLKQELNKYPKYQWVFHMGKAARAAQSAYNDAQQKLLNNDKIYYNLLRGIAGVGGVGYLVPELVPQSKKSGGILIKKENRGKFTDYCDGNVTQDCINKAKQSGNKKLIKRAVFAENARKWNK